MVSFRATSTFSALVIVITASFQWRSDFVAQGLSHGLVENWPKRAVYTYADDEQEDAKIDGRILFYVCDDSDGPDSDDCFYNQCTSCLEPVFVETCSGDHYPMECCNSLSRYIWCLTDRSLVCGTSMSDGMIANSLTQTFEDFCGNGCPIDWKGCDNELLCTCFREYNTKAFDCRYSDDTCRCPLEMAFVECTQPEVEACGNPELRQVHMERIRQRDEICARAAGNTPSLPLPPAYCLDDDGPDADACLYNECIACFEPLKYIMCSGDHYPTECCDILNRYQWCLTDRALTCGTALSDGAMAQGLIKTAEDHCGDGCPIDWEGCDNELLCSCFQEYKTQSQVCMYSDDACRCPLETAFIECTQFEVDACGNQELDRINAERMQKRDEICARAN